MYFSWDSEKNWDLPVQVFQKLEHIRAVDLQDKGQVQQRHFMHWEMANKTTIFFFPHRAIIDLDKHKTVSQIGFSLRPVPWLETETNHVEVGQEMERGSGEHMGLSRFVLGDAL